MNQECEKELLSIIYNNEDFDSLLNKQITYSQIAETLLKFTNEEMICNTTEGFVLTEKGKLFLKPKFEKIDEKENVHIAEHLEIDDFLKTEYIKGVIKELKN